MKGIGALVFMAFLLLIIAIVTNVCTSKGCGSEGFTSVLPPKNRMLGAPPGGNPIPYTDVADLPSAPIAGLAQTNPIPFQDPATVKTAFTQLAMLKADMDGFAANELPYMKEYSDPAIQLPITRFKGDYQRVKDELLTIQASPGLQPQMTMDDLDIVAANLRNLQRAYRTYAKNEMVPPPTYDMSKAGIEGFASPTSPPISVDQLTTLSNKIAVEIARLQASGTSDPVMKARVTMFSKIGQNVADIQRQVKTGAITAGMIPITQQDYANFLPALGDTSAGVGGLLSKAGNPTMSSLFNSYDQGDISGSQLAASLFSGYADKLLDGLSIKYTSPNEVALAQAQRAAGAAAVESEPSMRGEFDYIIQNLSNRQRSASASPGPAASSGSVGPQAPSGPQASSGSVAPAAGGYDWKAMAASIAQNIRNISLKPADFGCITPGTQVSPDFSWRGHCKMVCSRLATHYDPGMPEQMGCPPATWKGWRL